MTNPGLAYLVGKTKGGEISTRCVKVKTILDNREYYLPVDDVKKVMPMPTPPFPIHAEEWYSEILDKDGAFLGVKKHDNLTILGTGCTVEVVDHPAWWSKRDSNGI